MKIFDVNDKEKNILLSLFIVSLIIRIIYSLEIINAPFSNYLYLDPKLYSDFASHFFSAGFWGGNEPVSIPILYPLVIYLAHLFTGHNFTLFIFQSLLGSISVLLIYLSARNFFDKNIALLSSLVAALFAPYIFYTGLITYETLEVFLVSILIFLISKPAKDYNRKLFLYTGIVLGLLFLIRESYIVIILLYLSYPLINKSFFLNVNLKSKKIAAAIILGVMIILVPVLLVNFFISGSVVLNSTNAGINFNIANNTDSKAIFIDPSNFDYKADPSGKNLASSFESKEMTPSEAQNYWYRETVNDIISSPSKFAGNALVKILLLFDSNDLAYSSMYDADFYRENYSDFLKLPFINFGAVALFAIAGLFLYFKRENRNRFFGLFIFGYLIMVLFGFANLRFRLGVTPLFIILATYSLFEVVNCFKNDKLKKLTMPIISVVIVVLLNTFFIKKPVLNNSDAYFHLAKIAENEERFEEAIYNFNRSILLDDNYKTFLNLGNTFAKKKDFNNALAAYNEAEKRNSEDYLLYFNRGIVLTQNGSYDEAIAAYRKTLQFNPNHYPVYRNIGIIFYVNENYEEAEKYFKRFMALSDDEETKALVRKDLENIRLKLQK